MGEVETNAFCEENEMLTKYVVNFYCVGLYSQMGQKNKNFMFILSLKQAKVFSWSFDVR